MSQSRRTAVDSIYSDGRAEAAAEIARGTSGGVVDHGDPVLPLGAVSQGEGRVSQIVDRLLLIDGQPAEFRFLGQLKCRASVLRDCSTSIHSAYWSYVCDIVDSCRRLNLNCIIS